MEVSTRNVFSCDTANPYIYVYWRKAGSFTTSIERSDSPCIKCKQL